MEHLDPITHIKGLCSERGWSLYQLAKESGIPYSTLNTLINNKNMPTLVTLQKICSGLGISMSEFFSPGHDTVYISAEQAECLALFNSLSSEEKKLATAYMKGLKDS